MPIKRVFERDRLKDGTIRQFRRDAQIGEVAPDIQEHFGYRYDKSVGSVCDENHVTSISQLREKIRNER